MVVPLLDLSSPTAGWLTLDDALARGVTEITEVSEAGSVPQLRLLNRGDEPVFLLDGEELIGAKQNRILNLSILAPGRTNLEIPVSCVEQGRWSWRAGGFSSADRVIYAKLRRSNAEAVSGSLASTRDRRGDQGKVWDEALLVQEAADAIRTAALAAEPDSPPSAGFFISRTPSRQNPGNELYPISPNALLPLLEVGNENLYPSRNTVDRGNSGWLQ